jgi:hypothetical protein
MQICTRTATGSFYTRQLGAFHKTERLSAILGFVAPQTPRLRALDRRR